MKSLFLTAILVVCVAHAGAFLTIWELPYLENHITKDEFGRKLNNVFKWDEKLGSLREAREKAAEDNYSLYNSESGQNAGQKSLQDAAGNRKHQMSAPAPRR